MAQSELACTYAALILHDDGLEITAENILTITKAAGLEVEAYWPSLFAKLFAKKSMDDLITNVGSGGGAPAAAAAGPAAAAPAAAPKKEEKKEPSEEEDLGFSLFD
ncbi:60S acidic ribosomal protein P1 [Tetrabaena socialis]|uniref:60S acidic ribosomal protein P1 n=1 Tax=Tetrabaena socialis TaxID=47790 RepID=A0A2J8A229_9CHLO|nr:60S acidic ribosomal protein P1 [Tetrabaena socialis]|eukprot:PNH06586.1 60S acidic ribosomal protein P1 [Tetrabaena socialis]